ncbi:MAG TPA: 5-deoxy-glucuronate isomerase [Chloroflexota bacterium]
MVDLVRRPARVAPDGAAWRFIHFEACRLRKGDKLEHKTEDRETALVVLGGMVAIDVGSDVFVVAGRQDVWERTAPSLVLLPPETTLKVEAASEAEIVIAGAVAENSDKEPRLITPDDILVEKRGEGQTLRYVHHLLPPSAEAQRLILVEVYTPAGNWSSFPPHKHDTDDPPRESYLEEIYYYHVSPPTGFALQRVYTADGTLDEAIAAHDGDLVLVPRGYHVVANTPGHECYYLNVMAGTSRVWNFTLDPAYKELMNWQKIS